MDPGGTSAAAGVAAPVVPPERPPEDLRFRRRLSPRAALAEAWAGRGLVAALAERELRARYKQALLGFAWGVITPVALMLVFVFVFKRVANVDSEGVPYPLFSYVGLLAWAFFASAINAGGNSLLANQPLLNKVRCPREVFPLGAVVVAAVDLLAASVVLVVLFAVTGELPRATAYWLPIYAVVHVAFTVGVALALAGVFVYVRDLRHAVPLTLQLGLFLTPVGYSLAEIPSGWRVLYVVVNPVAAAIDGYRRALLRGVGPDWEVLLPAAGSAAVVLMAGYWLFKRLEVGVADVS